MTSVPDRLAHLAATRADEPAIVVAGGEDLTFGSWAARAAALAQGLADRGTRPGDRVALRFDAASWAAFATAHVGVLAAGGVAVLVPAGLADADAARIISSSGAVGLLCPSHLAVGRRVGWTATPHDVARGGGTAPLPRRCGPQDPAELCYPLAPLARPRPQARTHGDLLHDQPRPPGWLVHAWGPGSQPGQQALGHVLAGHGAATLARFTPEGLCDLIDRLGATTCGLTPGLAAALLSGCGAGRPLASVTRVELSGDPGLLDRQRLAAAFPGAVLDHHEETVERPAGPPPEDLAGAEGEPAPAGASQLGMVWHEQLAPGSFNLPCLVRRYRGVLDVDAFFRALTELARRHEPLRTTFELRGGEPRLVVRPSGPAPVLVDLAGLAPAERDERAAELLADATSRPFDLVEDPLFAPHLLRLADDDHVLVVRLHHTAFDDWSVDVFRRELSGLYASSLAGEPPAQPPPVTFSDACRRQRARLDGGAGDADRRWWREQMEGAPFPVQLPLGDPDQLGPDRPGAGQPLRHDLDADLARRVRALSRELRATPFMTVLAAFGLLLSRRTGLDDVVLASVVAGRPSADVEPLIGCFTKKVLLRLRLDGDPGFPDVVARTRTTVLEALAHQDLPFESVVHEALGGPATAHGLAAHVPVVFQGETPQPSRLVLPGIRAEPFTVPAAARQERHFSARDGDRGSDRPVWGDGAYLGTFLLLSLQEVGEGLGLVARGVFHRPAAQQLVDELEALLEEIVAAPFASLAMPVGRQACGPHELSLRGLRLQAPRLEAALARCAGVADAAVAVVERGSGPILVAYVVPDRQPPPTLPQLRAALWEALPGSAWPAASVNVDTLPRGADGRPDLARLPPPEPGTAEPAANEADLLAALWSAARGAPLGPGDGYWQDVTFLGALAEARAAGLAVTDEQVTRCRTPEMLAATLTAG